MKKVFVILLVLAMLGMFSFACNGKDVNGACENMIKLTLGEEVPEGMSEEEYNKQKKEFLDSCIADLKEESAEVINCVAKAESWEDLEKCEPK